MAEVASAFVSVIPSARGFGKKLDGQISGDLDKSGKTAGRRWGGALKTAALAGMAGLAIAGAKILSSSVTAASNAQQSLGATEAIFGKFAGNVVRTSDKAAQAFGLSANQYRESANLLGALFKNQGVELGKLSGATEKHVGLAADLSAMYGGKASDAVEAITAAYKGEFNQLEKYGVTMKQSIINTEAETIAKKQYGKALKDLTPAQESSAKQMATQALLMRQTSDAAGAFGKESNTLAGQQQRLGAQWEDMKATLGAKLLPELTRLASWVNSTGLPALEDLASAVKDNAGKIGIFAGAVAAGVVAAKGYLLVTTLVAAAQARQAVAAGTATAAQTALNVAMRANIIGLVVTAVFALAAALVYAYKKSETFRNIVNGAFSIVRRGIAKVVGAVGGLMGMWASMLRALSKAPGFGWAKGAADAMQNAANRANGLAASIRGIPSEKTITIRQKYEYFGGSLPAGAGTGVIAPKRRAKGGPVSGRTPYLVGEKGPELYIPNQSGRIIPNHKLTGSGSALGGAAVPIVNVRIGDLDFESYVEAIVADALEAAS